MHTITKLRAADRRSLRTLVQLDGEDWAVLDSEVVLRNHLAKGSSLTEEECDALLKEDAFVRARQTAAFFLSTRVRSTEELRRRLREFRPKKKRRRRKNEEDDQETLAEIFARKPFDEDTIEAVIAYFRDSGRLDDADFARRYVRHYLKVKAVGRLRLRNELLQLGVAENVAEKALEEEFSEAGDQSAMIRRFIERKLPRLRRDEPRKRRAKLEAALLRAGFEPDAYRPILKAAIEEEEASLELE